MTGPLEKPAIRAPSTEQEQPASITFLLSSRSSNPLNNKDIPSEVIICAEEMAAINEQNEILLNQALEMVEFDLTLLKSMRQAPETANYNKNACNTGDLLGSSGFDAKQ